jgi:titin
LAPTQLTPTGGTNQIALNWTAPSYSSFNSTNLTFNVYRGTTAGGESMTPLATGLTTPTFTDTTVVVGQSYYYQVTAVEVGGESAKSNEVVSIAGPPPALLSEIIGDGTAQRSAFKSVTVTFSQPVTPAAGAFTLSRLTTDSFSNILTTADVSAAVTASNPSADGMTWVLTVTPGGTLDDGFGDFLDGIYRLTVHAAKVANAAGATLAGGDQVEPAFSKLYGDVNGDGTVNPLDFGRFRTAYGSNLGDAKYVPAFDINHDSTIGTFDFGKFKSNYGKSLYVPISYAYATDASTYSGAAGSTVTVSLYLIETGGNSLIAADQGLVGAGAAATRLSGGSTVSAINLDTADFDGGPTLSTQSITNGGASANFTEAVGLADATGPMGTTFTGGRQVLLGTLTITLSATPGTTLFTLGRNPGGAGSSVTFTGSYNLDASGNTLAAPYMQPAADGNNYSWTGVNTNVWTFKVNAI